MAISSSDLTTRASSTIDVASTKLAFGNAEHSVSYSSTVKNQVRLQLHALAYNLGNFLRTLALPQEVEHWSLTTLRA